VVKIGFLDKINYRQSLSKLYIESMMSFCAPARLVPQHCSLLNYAIDAYIISQSVVVWRVEVKDAPLGYAIGSASRLWFERVIKLMTESLSCATSLKHLAARWSQLAAVRRYRHAPRRREFLV